MEGGEGLEVVIVGCVQKTAGCGRYAGRYDESYRELDEVTRCPNQVERIKSSEMSKHFDDLCRIEYPIMHRHSKDGCVYPTE